MKTLVVSRMLGLCVSLFVSFSAAAVPVAGDIDLSGDVDAVDVQLTINAALGISISPRNGDIEGSGGTDAVDVQLVINAALGIVIDADGDGLCDAFELRLGTNPENADTDGDGVGDGQETVDGTDPLVSDDSVNVPDVVALSQSAAELAITAAGLSIGSVTTEYSNTVAADIVISQNPSAATSVDAGDSVDIVVSLGPPPVEVPDVVGLSQSAAELAITAAGLSIGSVTTEYSNTVEEERVISQDPAGGAEAVAGSPVNLVVSKGIEVAAGFAVLPSSGTVPLEVEFMYDQPEKTHMVTAWAWDFDNYGIVDSSQPAPT